MKLRDSKTGSRRRRRVVKKQRPSSLRVKIGMREQRKIRRRILKTIFGAAVIACVVLLVRIGSRMTFQTLLSRNDLFRIREYDIRCYGDVIKPEHVMEYASLGSYSNLFAMNIRDIHEHLVSSVPRIKTVDISRYLHGVLSVHVRERDPIARLAMNGRYYEVCGDGYVLGLEARSQFLPVVSGHHLSVLRPGVYLGSTPIMNAIEVFDLCETTSIGRQIKISDIDISHHDALKLHLIDGEKVMFAWNGMGRRTESARDNLERKMALLVENIKAAELRGERILELDMRMERNFPARCVPM